MLKMRIDFNLDRNFILCMIDVYLYGITYPRKSDFMSYMKGQIESFGIDEISQFGESGFRDKKQAEIFMSKWFPTEKEKENNKKYYAEKNYYKSAKKLANSTK